MRRLRPLGCVLFALLFAPRPASAQAPSIREIFPPGGRAGSRITASLSGAALDGAREVLIAGRGVSVELGKGGTATSLPLSLVVAPDAPAGPREVRVITGRGASNAGYLWVGQLPDLLEKEPNDAPSAAQPADGLPAAVNGRIEKATDVDSYRFRAGAGQTWVFRINAAGHRSALDPYLTLLDERGRTLCIRTDGFGRDPELVHTFREAGTFTLQVRDTLFRGRPGYTYRLSLGILPQVRRWRPLGAQRGTSATVTLEGVNLKRPVQAVVAIPASPDSSEVLLTPRTDLGPAGPVRIYAADAPEVAEWEPNDTTDRAMRYGSFPLVLDGWMDRSGDRDVFALPLREKQVLYLEIVARRIGSRMDPVLRVLDAAGKEVAANDDALGKDPRLTFTAPKAGEYRLEVRNLTARAGDDHFYRLVMRDPPLPDFTLTVTPDNPTAPAGAAVALTVSAQRNGYAGEIEVRVEGLPAGASAGPARIPAGQSSALLTLQAPPCTAAAVGRLRIIGRATIGDRLVERTAVPQERYQPPLTQPNQAVMRDTELLLGGIGPEPPYVVAVGMQKMEVKAGQKVEIPVRVTRRPEFKEGVALTLLGLPGTVKPAALTLNKDQSEGKLTLTADAKAAPGTQTIVLQGNGKNVLVCAPAVELVVLPAK